MNRRPFGRTGISVSERGFGAWAIGGRSFGAVPPRDALDALARAEEHGCNFVDTAAVYGDSEALLGTFLRNRRDRWIVATKYSGQPEGMTALLEQQLQRLGTDYIDFYQIHWAPSVSESGLYEELETLKRCGKVRFAGVSLKTLGEMQRVLSNPVIDGVQLPISLLDPEPLVSALPLLRIRKPALVARSALRGGFLAGRYGAQTRFLDTNDQRSQWDSGRIARLSEQASAFDFLKSARGSLRDAALAYPLSFPEVSTLIVSCKNATQVDENLADSPPLGDEILARIAQTQRRLGIGKRPLRTRIRDRLRRLLGRGN